jgi:hypothetical protein
MEMQDELGNTVELTVGMKLRVRFGSYGSQSAEVVKITKAGNVYVKKHRNKSGTWTKPIRLWPGELLGRCS